MATRALTTAEKFLFGYPLLSAIRKVAAIAVTLACLFYAFGVLKVAVFGAFGALCLSMMDLPGSPRQVIYAFGMGAALAFTSAAIIALTAAHPIWVTAAFTGLTWFFSTLVVYGKRGAVTSIGCLVLSLIAMYAVGQGMSVAELLLAMAAGMVIYMVINVALAFLLQRWEQAHRLVMALYATANYLKYRSRLLDARIPLEDAARATISAQAVMADMHQSARDMIFSRWQTDTNEASPRYHELARVLYHMVSLHDMLLGSYPDYKQLRQVLGQHEILNLSARILSTLAEQTDWIALAVTQHKPAREHRSATSDLIELEKSIAALEHDETVRDRAQLMPVLRQLQHRLVTAYTTIQEMIKATQLSTNDSLECAPALPPFVRHMLSRQSYSPKLLLENLRLDSPPFRIALRVSIAVLIGLLIGLAFPVLGAHAYWIVLTIIIIHEARLCADQTAQYRTLVRHADRVPDCTGGVCLDHQSHRLRRLG